MHKHGRCIDLKTATMICASGTTIHGLNVERVEIKCSAIYGTPKWVLLDSHKPVPKCLKFCESNADCNTGSFYTSNPRENKGDAYLYEGENKTYNRTDVPNSTNYFSNNSSSKLPINYGNNAPPYTTNMSNKRNYATQYRQIDNG